MDQFKYPLGEDQMLAYKLFLSGHLLLMHFDSGIEHINARSSHTKKDKEYYHGLSSIRYTLWYRSIFQTRTSILAKSWSVVAFYSSWIWLSMMDILLWVIHREPLHIRASVMGLIDARRYVESDEFRKIPVWKRKTTR